MELSYVFSAIRRYLWVVQIAALLGVFAGLYVTSQDATSYEASSSLLVRPPQTGDFVPPSTDRYIDGEAVILRSSTLRDEVEARIAGEVDGALEGVIEGIDVTTAGSSDVVEIVVRASTPDLAIAAANGVILQYLDNKRSAADAQYDTSISSLDQQLGTLQEDLNEAQRELFALPEEPETIQDEIVGAQISARVLTIESQWSTLFSRKTDLELARGATIRDEVAEFSSSATELRSQGQILPVAGAIGGALLGIAAAVLLAGVSGRVLDSVQLEQILASPVVGTFYKSRKLSAPIDALSDLPRSAATVIDEACVRAEAVGYKGGPVLTIVVAGTQPEAGTTTVALAMAGRFVLNGAVTPLIIDADQLSPTITEIVGDRVPGLSEYLAETAPDAGPDQGRSSSSVAVRRPSLLQNYIVHWPLPGVDVMGLGYRGDGRPLQSTNAKELIDAAAESGRGIVIIDAGALLKSASSVRLAQLADVVVLAVPHRNQQTESLSVVRRLIDEGQASVLAVQTEPRRRWWRRNKKRNVGNIDSSALRAR